MVQVRISIPDQPDREVAVGSLPARLGRAHRCEIVCEADGLWDEHLRLSLDAANRLAVEAVHHALVTVNDRKVETAVLKPRDRIRCGAALLEVSPAPPVPRGDAPSGLALWCLFAVVLLVQPVLAGMLLP